MNAHIPQPSLPGGNRLAPNFQNPVRKIQQREATIGIVGRGHVGLPLSDAFREAGFRVLTGDRYAERPMGRYWDLRRVINLSGFGEGPDEEQSASAG